MKFLTHFQYAALLCCVLLGPGCSDDKTGGKTDGEPTQAPVFTAFSPERGQAGDVITITGSYFGTDASRITVLINSTPAKITGVTDTAISAVVPDECGSGEIRIGLRRSSGGGICSSMKRLSKPSSPTPSNPTFLPLPDAPVSRGSIISVRCSPRASTPPVC